MGQGYNRPTGCSAEKAPYATFNFSSYLQEMIDFKDFFDVGSGTFWGQAGRELPCVCEPLIYMKVQVLGVMKTCRLPTLQELAASIVAEHDARIQKSSLEFYVYGSVRR